MLDKRIDIWLANYLRQLISPSEREAGTKHVIFSFVDHYEPFNSFNSGGDFKTASKRIQSWVELYPKIARKHKDADGRFPQHTWFYPPHHEHGFLETLVQLCRQEYGEIEMHLHHNHMNPFPDTEETLRAKIIKCIEDYSKYGIFCLPDGSKAFCFIHGDWSLDNSRGNKFCGVNNEISILKECGCFADFTFPSLGKTQPAMINKIYYAKDDPDKPKSYNTGKELFVGGKPWGDLLIIQGIIGLRWKSRTHRFRPSIESSSLDKSNYPFQGRTDYWIKNGIRIKGRPNWLFVKLHTHGAREDTWDSLLGDRAEAMFSYLEKKYNDGKKYALHYVTSREMYNIIKAAEAGKEGDPNQYRDFKIQRYIYLKKR